MLQTKNMGNQFKTKGHIINIYSILLLLLSHFSRVQLCATP